MFKTVCLYFTPQAARRAELEADAQKARLDFEIQTWEGEQTLGKVQEWAWYMRKKASPLRRLVVAVPKKEKPIAYPVRQHPLNSHGALPLGVSWENLLVFFGARFVDAWQGIRSRCIRACPRANSGTLSFEPRGQKYPEWDPRLVVEQSAQDPLKPSRVRTCATLS